MLQVNFNKLNTVFSDENAQARTIGNNPKQQLQQKVVPGNENYVQPMPLKAVGGGDGLGKGALLDLKEPSPPKLKSHSRNNNLRQGLTLAQIDQQQQQQQQQVQIEQPKQQQISHLQQLLELEPLMTQPSQPQQPAQQQQSQPQESVISRIPRLSLRPLAALNPNVANNGRTTRATLANKQLADVTNRCLAEIQEKKSEEELEKRQHVVLDNKRDEEQQQIEDIDKSTSRDAIFLVSDIAKDIYQYMFDLEEQQSIQFDHLKDQKIFTPKVRQRLINWCIEIHTQLKLLPETLYMTIAVIDRFFNRVTVKQQSQVQLIAVGATLIASKYEEIYPPEINDLMHLTQNAYTRREIMRAEIYILEQLNFNLGKPIPLAFLRRFSKAAHCDTKMHSMAKYLMELSLSEYECSHWKPSFLAAAALFATIHLVHHDAPGSRLSLFGRRTSPLAALGIDQQQPDRWTKSLVHYTHYTRQELLEPAARLCKILKRAQKSPQSYYCAKKNVPNMSKWPEFKSSRVDEVIKMGEQH